MTSQPWIAKLINLRNDLEDKQAETEELWQDVAGHVMGLYIYRTCILAAEC